MVFLTSLIVSPPTSTVLLKFWDTHAKTSSFAESMKFSAAQFAVCTGEKSLLPSVLLVGRKMCVHCTAQACAVQQPSLGRTPKITSKWHSVNAACPTCDIKTFRTGSNQTQFLPQTLRGCSSCLKTLFLPNSIFPH